MAKNSPNDYEVSLVMDGPVMLQGDIQNIDDVAVTIRARKDGSKKYHNHVVPMNKVELLEGKAGGPGLVIYRGKVTPAKLLGTVETKKNGFVEVSTFDGSFMIRADSIVASAPTDEPGEKLKPKKIFKHGQQIVTRKPKKQITEKQRASAKKNLDKAREKKKKKKK